jgi:uncharacterized protein (UPF0332 family)
MNESFIARAKENLADAEAALEATRYNASANRAYYAAFHAAIAALLHFGHKVNIDHTPVRSDFSRFLINERKVFPSAMKNDLRDLMAVRGTADYGLDGISKKTAFAQLKLARVFTERILSIIDNQDQQE